MPDQTGQTIYYSQEDLTCTFKGCTAYFRPEWVDVLGEDGGIHTGWFYTEESLASEDEVFPHDHSLREDIDL